MTDARLLYAREADRSFRLRNGTAANAYRAGQIPGRVRGRRVLISAKRAEELWGVK